MTRAVLSFAQGAGLGFSAAVSPGPFQAFLLARAVRHGALRTLPAAVAPLASDGPIIALVLLALTRAPAGFLRGVQVAGGLLLLWLAWTAARAFRSPAGGTPPPEPGAPLRGFGQAILVNALSPGPWIFWSLVTGPILVRAWRESAAEAASFLAGFYLVLCGGNAALVLAFAGARRLGPRATRALGALSAAVLLGFGLLQLWRGFTGR